MRKLLGLALLTLLASLILVSRVHAGVQDFVIKDFSADYYISRNDQKTSQVKVEEVIQAEFPSYDQNHGIERALPETYQGHTASLEITGVTNESGQAYPYTTYQSNDNKVLRIGSANTYAHGLTTYKISYTLRNVINFQAQDEFYWDVNGDQWKQTVQSVTARVHVPSDLQSSLTGQKVCYSGAAGQNTQNCTITTIEEDGLVILTTNATNLSPSQTLTFDVGFSKGTFVMGPEVAAEDGRNLLVAIVMALVIGLPPIVTFVMCFSRWRKNGRDPKGRGVIIPEYVAPQGLSVVSSSFILEQSIDPKAISAGIIELAIKGYLRLSETTKKKLIGSDTDYQIELVKDSTGLPEEQRKILTALFGQSLSIGSKISVSAQKNKLANTVEEITNYISPALTQAGYFSSDPQKAAQGFVGATAVLIFGGFFVLKFFIPLGIGMILSGAVTFVFIFLIPARSAQGVAMRDYLKGLQEYIKLAEADRIKYLQSPQGVQKVQIDPNDPAQQIKLFESLLPYAMLFGLENEWAKQFNNLYTQPPTWYGGNMNGFNAVYLADSLGSFSTANAASFTAPSSSGSSGFGGGGFSGGGGGGGGGGGW